MENNFEELKKELLEKAKTAGACNSGYRKAEGANDEAGLLKVVNEYLDWCSNSEIITNEWLSKFNPAILLASGCANTGLENTGLANSGDSNSGYRNSGAFCTDKNPTLFLFNKAAKMTVKEWENSKAFNLMLSIDPTIWVPWNAMSEEEKKSNPKLEASEGYTKSIPLKDAWKNTWGNWSEENKKVFTDLENFDSSIFEEITGVKI